MKKINKKQKSYFGIIISSLFIIGFSMINTSISAQVGINTTGDAPNASAMLDIVSTTKGVLFPRVALTGTSSASPVTSPATGLMVFNTATAGDVVPGYYWWDSSEWISFGSGSGGGCTLDQAYDFGGAGVGRVITANDGAVEITISNTTSGNKGLIANSSANLSFAVSSIHSGTGVGFAASVTNSSNTYAAFQAETNAATSTTSAIVGITKSNAYGITGQVDAGAPSGAAIFGNNLRNVDAAVSSGVYGQTACGNGYGVLGENISSGVTYNNIGVGGWGSYIGVYGRTTGGGFGVYSFGELGSNGTKSFVIDHPLDPENKTLKHFCAESPEVLNIYRGNIILDSNGEAVVELPDYFDAININFSYYLTPIGKPVVLYIKEEVKNNKFIIAGGEENVKVSWVLYAERNDLYMQEYPKSKEVESEKRQKGKYYRPELYGKPESEAIIPMRNTKSETQNILSQ